MNQEERDFLAKKLINLALFYGKYDLTKNAVMQFINVLETFYNKSCIDYENALNNYCADSLNKYFPSPSQLKQYLIPNPSSRDQAQEIAQRCFGAIKKFGYTKPGQAKEYIGDLGWKLIERRGGWYFHCTETNNSDIPILTAQFRDILQVYVIQGNIDDREFFDKAQIAFKEVPILIKEIPEDKFLDENKIQQKKEDDINRYLKLLKEKNNKPKHDPIDIEKAKEIALIRFKDAFGEKNDVPK